MTTCVSFLDVVYSSGYKYILEYTSQAYSCLCTCVWGYSLACMSKGLGGEELPYPSLSVTVEATPSLAGERSFDIVTLLRVWFSRTDALDSVPQSPKLQS